MFTGIVEEIGRVDEILDSGSGKQIWIESNLTPQLKIDQSISHNGACLTVDKLGDSRYRVTAIEETLRRTNLGELEVGDSVNLERCMPANGRFDGHIVQGHVDCVGECDEKENRDGSWIFRVTHPVSRNNLTVEKGSITVNGVSLTVVDSNEDSFTVAIIPYTYEHTNFRDIEPGSKVNLEFDILGKYVSRILGN